MSTDPRIDRYIENAAAFAQPILIHLRALVHKGCPEVTEDIKWSRPVFLYLDKITYSMAAFKSHCGFGFWHPEMAAMLEADGRRGEEGSGSLGRITQLSDLPPDKTLLHYIRHARQIAGKAPAKTMRQPPAPRHNGAAEIPPELANAFARDRQAGQAFHALSASHRREYIEWIVDAKRDETRQKRIDTTLEWVREGKPRNWKYEQSSSSR